MNEKDCQSFRTELPDSIPIPEGYEATIRNGRVFFDKKEPDLTSYEEDIRNIVIEHLTTTTKSIDGSTLSCTVAISNDTAKRMAHQIRERTRVDIAVNIEKLRIEAFTQGYRDARVHEPKWVRYNGIQFDGYGILTDMYGVKWLHHNGYRVKVTDLDKLEKTVE